MPVCLLVSLTSTLFAQQVIQKDDYLFTMQQTLSCNPVEDQAGTGTCWSFSTGSFLESEAIRNGKQPINLSEMYWVREAYMEKGEKYLRYHGKTNFGQGGLSHDVLRLFDEYGAIPEAVYDGKTDPKKRHNHNKLEKELLGYLDSLISSKTIDAAWRSHYASILDAHLGACPEKFEYEGETYDAKSFASAFVGVDAGDYVTVTSFQHRPPYSKFVLEVPDNYSNGVYLNLPLEDLQAVLRKAIKEGHSVVWDCDVSEQGFSARQGLAIVPIEDEQVTSVDPFRSPHQEQKITGAMRQREFDSYSLTDDHLMHIVGFATDQEGASYYYVKNSWGKNPGFDGYLFASESYVLLNTIGLTVHKDALSSDLLHKVQMASSTTD